MENLEINAKRLLVVKPSVILRNGTEIREGKTNCIIDFRHDEKDVSIAEDLGTRAKDVFDDIYYQYGVGEHCVNGNLHVNISAGDMEPLLAYLWRRYNGRVNYVAQFGPEVEAMMYASHQSFSIPELRVILDEMKAEIQWMIDHGKILSGRPHSLSFRKSDNGQ